MKEIPNLSKLEKTLKDIRVIMICPNPLIEERKNSRFTASPFFTVYGEFQCPDHNESYGPKYVQFNVPKTPFNRDQLKEIQQALDQELRDGIVDVDTNKPF